MRIFAMWVLYLPYTKHAKACTSNFQKVLMGDFMFGGEDIGGEL